MHEVLFLSRSAMEDRDLAIDSVSVCLTHAGTETKVLTVGSCGYHYRVAQRLQFFKFFDTNFRNLGPRVIIKLHHSLTIKNNHMLTENRKFLYKMSLGLNGSKTLTNSKQHY